MLASLECERSPPLAGAALSLSRLFTVSGICWYEEGFASPPTKKARRSLVRVPAGLPPVIEGAAEVVGVTHDIVLSGGSGLAYSLVQAVQLARPKFDCSPEAKKMPQSRPSDPPLLLRGIAPPNSPHWRFHTGIPPLAIDHLNPPIREVRGYRIRYCLHRYASHDMDRNHSRPALSRIDMRITSGGALAATSPRRTLHGLLQGQIPIYWRLRPRVGPWTVHCRH